MTRRTILACAMAVAIGACQGPVASRSDGAILAEPVSRTVERDGVVVALSIERGVIETGGQLAVAATVRNVGPGPVTWQSGGCELMSGFGLEGPEVVQPPPGADWQGTAHWAKWSATTGGIGLSGPLPPGRLPDPRGMACTMELRVEDTDSGATERVDVVWRAITSDGAPAPPGPYRLTFSFPFLARVAADDFNGDPHEDQRPITVSVDFVVVGEPFAGIPSTLAADRALADQRVQAWISTVRHQDLNGATIVLRDGNWTFEIVSTRGTAVISIDADDGTVLDVVIGPPPPN